jgi:2-polyprenyl-6-methoxyphenol hydroxylase-like FAD-dependent oxidoreductase
MSTSETRKAIVVGAGIGGLTTALSLRRAGIDVAVVERSERLREVPAAVALWPSAVKILRGLGLGEAIEAVGTVSTGATVRTWRGTRLADAASNSFEERFGAPLVVLPRTHLHALLDGALDPDPVRLGAGVVRVSQREALASVHLADRSSLHADFVIGADGIDSRVRDHVSDEGRARYSGYTAWQGIAESARDLEPGILYGPGASFGIARLADGQAYWWASAKTPFLAAGDRVETPELLARFKDWEPVVPWLIEATRSSAIVRTPLLSRPHLRSLALGRVAVLGDAAHPMLPILALGASQAIEDAAVLARSLAAKPHTQEALDRYSSRRLRRTTALARRSRQATRVAHLENPVAAGLRNAALRVVPDLHRTASIAGRKAA